VEKNLDGAKKKPNSFFCSCRAFFGGERSLEGAQGIKLKPRENLGCLPPLFSSA